MKSKMIYTLEQLQGDIIRAAEVAEVPYNEKKIGNVLKAYCDFFLSSAVTFVTSTKPKEKRALSYRYVDIQTPHNPFDIALKNGFITKLNHPIDNLFNEIVVQYPIMGYGIDADSAYGLAKIWTFFQIPQSLTKAYTMTSLPKSIKNNADYFSKFDLKDFHLFALDYRKLSINLYFMVKELGMFPPEKVARMIGDLGLNIPSQEILEYCSKAITIYYSFSWTSPRIERVCFGVIAEDQSEVPTHLHPVIEHYAAQAPFFTETRKFILGITPSHDGDYIKIESDYADTMNELMKRGAQAEIWLEEMKRQDVKKLETADNRNWEPIVYDLFEKIVAGIPEAFREIVRPLLHETAEKKRLNGAPVNESNLITALFEITPDPFKPESMKNLKALGINYQKYLPT